MIRRLIETFPDYLYKISFFIIFCYFLHFRFFTASFTYGFRKYYKILLNVKLIFIIF